MLKSQARTVTGKLILNSSKLMATHCLDVTQTTQTVWKCQEFEFYRLARIYCVRIFGGLKYYYGYI